MQNSVARLKRLANSAELRLFMLFIGNISDMQMKVYGQCVEAHKCSKREFRRVVSMPAIAAGP
ncbi:hypothetical protein [Paraburkholderia susongensis]|uniref:hypothetical protein n=1 Tax=Paraburkholderia susongensis TaxID=1515439 RepID=UPI00117E354A|nr:hypothetical protein [Paraburkholderia susongensis]